MQTEMFILDNGKTIKRMGKEFICIKMVRSILVIGSEIPSKDLEGKNGLMDHLTRGIISI